MEVKHTQGPWYCVSGSVWTTPQGPDDGGISIGGPDRSEGRTRPCERDANARLMALAPEMLAVLRGLFHAPIGDVPTLIKAAAILDKAEGRA